MIKLGLVVAVLYFGSQKMLEVTSIRQHFIAECPVYLLNDVASAVFLQVNIFASSVRFCFEVVSLGLLLIKSHCLPYRNK